MNALDRVPAFGLGTQSKIAFAGIALLKTHHHGMTKNEFGTWAAEGLVSTGDASFAAFLTCVVALGAIADDFVRTVMLFCRPNTDV